MTSKRKVIAEVLNKSKDHPDVEELYQRASKIDPNISLATVYRTISIFEKNGIIKKLNLGDKKARYELVNLKRGHHYHLVDIDTGRIIEFSDKKLEQVKKDIAKRLGYKLVDHKLELYGRLIKK